RNETAEARLRLVLASELDHVAALGPGDRVRVAPIVIVLSLAARLSVQGAIAGDVHPGESFGAVSLRVHALQPDLFYGLIAFERSHSVKRISIGSFFFVETHARRIDQGRREN